MGNNSDYFRLRDAHKEVKEKESPSKKESQTQVDQQEWQEPTDF